MRLHRLEVEGFGPFRARQVVDFDAFADDGIFLIAGRTGAGKSSILDAVCFGLYGGVPRYDGGEKRLRSDHSEPDDPSEVVVDFSTTSGRFRVTRSPEYLRPARRGGGLTKQASAVALEELTHAGWVGRASRAVDVAHELEEILQLSREQFLQVILLAQNRFSEFLLANSKDRQALLRRLFGTERFEDVQARFDERRRASEQALGARRAQVGARLDDAEDLVRSEGFGPDADASAAGEGRSIDGAEQMQADAATAPADTEGRLAALRTALSRASYRAERRAAEREESENRLAAADAAATRIREERAAQTERDRSRAALSALEAELPRIDAERRELDDARSAEALRSVVDAVSRAQASADAASTAADVARETWLRVGVDDVSASADELRAWASDRTGEIGGWQQAARLEEQTERRRADLDAAQASVDAAARRIADIARERTGLPELITAATTARDEARRAADRVDDLTVRRDLAVARGRAVQQVEALGSELAAADRELADASDAVAAAAAALAALRRRRLDGFAGELASTLVAETPCPVCGALEHPAPAAHVDPVSADDVDAAEAVREAASDLERDVSARTAALRARLDAAESVADGWTADDAVTEIERAEAELRAATSARDAVAAREAELDALATRGAQLDDEQAAADRSHAEARERLAALEQSASDADHAIAEGRGTHDSVRRRIDEATAQVEAASAFATALRERDLRASALAEAISARDAALEASTFNSPAEVEAALRPASHQAVLDESITRHTVQRELEKSILLPLELRALPEEEIDVASAEEAAAVARGEWIAAVDRAGRSAVAAERLGSLITSAADEHSRSAADAAEHEVLQNLADALAGRGPNTRKMTLETFVLAAELEEIVSAANRRLHDMSTGRYQLRHSDALAARGAASGLGIVVFDAFTGQTRPAQSLSGGETFLSSLALALGLAEVVTARAGGIRLDTLFIDEGFGSLDGDTLDVAMRTLDELRQGGRTVGVISHVDAMQEQIPAQLSVRATPDGPSVIEVR